MGVKSDSLTVEVHSKLLCSRKIEVSGTEGGAVKCVDILRNTGGESDTLGLN